MDNLNFFRNAALAFGLLAAGSSFAAETSVPAARTAEQREASSGDIRSKMANMTPAQREAYRTEMRAKAGKMTPEQRVAFRAETKAKMDSMTPEQRAEVKGTMHEARANHDGKGAGHEHVVMEHERIHTGDMHGAGGMRAR